MADGYFIVYGFSVLADPSAGTQGTGGEDDAGSISINSGWSPFEADDIVEIRVRNVNENGEITGDSGIYEIVVYDSAADYLNGVAKYNYTPQNPGQEAQVQGDSSGLGDTYVRFNSNVLTPEQGDAPSFTQLLIAPEVDFTSASFPVTIDTHTDVDYDGDGSIDGSTTEDGNGLYNIENNQLAAVCFAAGTLIATPDGPRPIETLRPGDLIETLDHGALPLRWIGAARVAGTGRHAPVHICKGALGNLRDLYVSQNHRMLISGPMAELLFAEAQVLVAAKHLLNDCSIRLAPRPRVTYFHLLLDEHQVIFAEGTPAESLFLGQEALGALDEDSRDEILSLLPEADTHGLSHSLARYELTRPEARVWRASAPAKTFSPAAPAAFPRTR